MAGFFSPIVTESKVRSLPTIPACGACGLYKKCENPKLPVEGRGKRKILVIDSHPSANDDRRGTWGKAEYIGELESAFAACDVDLFRDCWYTGALICSPKGREPRSDQIENCRPNIFNFIKKNGPGNIVLLGADAVKSVLGHVFSKNPGGIEQWSGFRIPSQELNCWICPVEHPKDFKDKTAQVQKLIFRKQLKDALELDAAPWCNGKPDYAGRVKIMHDPDKVDSFITDLIDDGREVSFDYETNMKKPHKSTGKIICVSLSNGKRTGVFPFNDRTKESLASFLRCKDVGKISANMKFEYAWSVCKVGVVPRPFSWDVVLAEHVIDNRAGICGLKFQTFVNFGQPLYDTKIEPYLKSVKKGGYEPNRIGEADPRALFVYCGLDSLFAYLRAQQQRQTLGIPYVRRK